MLKKIGKLFLFLFLLFDVVYADTLNLVSEKYILYNLNENKILVEKDAHIKTNIASLTKIMTIIVSIENIEDFSEEITITNEMLKDIAWDVSVVGFKKGDKVTYDDLLYGAMLESGADATNALAISTSGSLENFVKKMNEKVQELGLKNTSFANVTGLYDKNNYSSAYDMAQILIDSLKNEKFKEVFETKNYTLSNGKKIKSTMIQYNKSDVEFITGSKTGYIKVAGQCLASTATINDLNYLLVTLNAFSNDKAVHVKDAINTYNYCKDTYSYHNYLTEDEVVVKLKTKYAKEKEIEIISSVNKKYFYDNTFNKNEVIYEYDGLKEISYFTKKGTKLGNVRVKYNNEIIDNFELVLNQELTFSLVDMILNHILELILVIFILIFIIKR